MKYAKAWNIAGSVRIMRYSMENLIEAGETLRTVHQQRGISPLQHCAENVAVGLITKEVQRRLALAVKDYEGTAEAAVGSLQWLPWP
jgi:hypothetical protein